MLNHALRFTSDLVKDKDNNYKNKGEAEHLL